MIGPPGLPKFGRRVFSFAAPKPVRSHSHHHTWKWLTGFYVAGVLAHFSHHMVDLPDGSNPSFAALRSPRAMPRTAPARAAPVSRTNEIRPSAPPSKKLIRYWFLIRQIRWLSSVKNQRSVPREKSPLARTLWPRASSSRR